MPQTEYPPQIEYHGRRLKYLVGPAIFVNLYYFLFLYCVDSFNFISRSEISFVKPSVKAAFYGQGLVFVVLLLVGFYCLANFRTLSERRSFAMLASATALFILTICLPMYFWGGSHRSMFGPLLATVTGLTVIVAQTPKIRLIFGLSCVALFTCLSLPTLFRDIFPVKDAILGRYTGAELYTAFQTLAAVLTIGIAFRLSWKHAQDRTIFGDEPKLHPLSVHATAQQRIEMVQTSIKFAVDINNNILAGGGQRHSECIKELKDEIKKHGQDVNEDNVWCAEWAPATDDIIPETLRSLAQIQASSNVTPEIENEVKKIAKNLLGKEESQWQSFSPGGSIDPNT